MNEVCHVAKMQIVGGAAEQMGIRCYSPSASINLGAAVSDEITVGRWAVRH